MGEFWIRFGVGDADFVLTEGGVARSDSEGNLALLVDPELNVPRILKENVMTATAEAALIAAGLR